MTEMSEEMVSVIIDRDSVAMGDDVDSHREFWRFPADATIDDLLVGITNSYVPGIAGLACWVVDVNTDDQPHSSLHPQVSARRRDIGVIYTRDYLGQEAQIGRLAEGRRTLADLARMAGVPDLDVNVRYRSGDMARLLSVSEVMASASFTGRQLVKLGSEAAESARTDWVRERELQRHAGRVALSRRSWIRANLLSGTAAPPGSELFIARNLHFLSGLLHPASMAFAAELLSGNERANYEDLTDADIAIRPAVVTLAMLIASFEWNSGRTSWRAGELPYGKTYFAFLTGCGYGPLQPIEKVMTGEISVEEFRFSPQDTLRMGRIKQLRARLNELRTGRYYQKTIGEQEYREAVGPVHDELRNLGDQPGPL